MRCLNGEKCHTLQVQLKPSGNWFLTRLLTYPLSLVLHCDLKTGCRKDQDFLPRGRALPEDRPLGACLLQQEKAVNCICCSTDSYMGICITSEGLQRILSDPVLLRSAASFMVILNEFSPIVPSFDIKSVVMVVHGAVMMGLVFWMWYPVCHWCC